MFIAVDAILPKVPVQKKTPLRGANHVQLLSQSLSIVLD